MQLSSGSSILVRLIAFGTKTFDLPAVADIPAGVSKLFNVDNGTGANQATTVFFDSRTLPAVTTTGTTSENLDLSGSLVDAFGDSVLLTKVKAIYVEALENNAGNVIFGGTGTTALLGFGSAASFVVIPPGQAVLQTNLSTAGWTITGGSADLIHFGNPATTAAAYRVWLIGS
jgi:hypothetical protein